MRLRCGVRRNSCVQGDRFAGAVLEDGTEMEADACIAAVPHDVLLTLTARRNGRAGSAARRIAAYQDVADYERAFLVRSHGNDGAVSDATRPHDAVDFQSARCFPAAPKRMARRRVQPDMTKERPGEKCVSKGAAAKRGSILQLVISASYDLVPRSRQEIIELCRRELAEVLPATREANVLKATVIKEVNATFSPEPGVDRWRPGANDADLQLVSGRRLDSNGLALDDGRRGAQRISRSRSGAHAFWPTGSAASTGFAGRRLVQVLGEAIRDRHELRPM